jgi:hypothetical protein
MVKVINRQALIAERAENKETAPVNVFAGTMRDNLRMTSPQLVQFPVENATRDTALVSAKGRWENSEGYAKLWQEIGERQHRIVNAAQAPAAADLAALISKVFIDITKRQMATGDYTSRVATEMTDLNFPQLVPLREIYPYRAKFQTISGANDSVPLVEQALGEEDSLSLTIKAAGWKTSLANLVYNTLHDLQKVTEAIAMADEDERNRATLGAIVGATYVASQKQAADNTANSSYDYKMYETFRKAIKLLRGLKDYRTERSIGVPSMSILCNSANTWDIERVIRGQLTVGGTTGTLTSQNLQGLPISEIIEYDQGNNNGFTWGKEVLSSPGVTAGKCYLFVPREYFWVANKRPLTLEIGAGSVLQLSQEERAWYRIQGEFSKVFFGSSYAGTGLGASYGAVVEISLPSA